MKSPESIEEERGDEKRMMEGESSRGDSPEKKRVRLDAEDQNPAICAMEEEEQQQQQQQQQMMVDVDPEATIQEEWKPSLKLYTREEYTMDDVERLDELIARHRDKQARLFAQELEKRKAERMLDHKEIHRVQTILQKVESLTLHVPRVPIRFTDESSMKEFFVLDPWDDDDFDDWDPDEQRLDLYYKRLFPIVKSAHIPPNPYFWNRLPEEDEQYLSLYSKLCGLVKQDEQSFILQLNLPTAVRLALFETATQIAKEHNLTKLESDDVNECLEDVFREGDIIAEHKLNAEYDVYLLEGKYEKSSGSRFIPKDMTPVFTSGCFFLPTLRQLKFDTWMDNRRHMNCGKEEHRKAIEALHAENLKEDCRTRIRFIKLKRAWAKEHGII